MNSISKFIRSLGRRQTKGKPEKQQEPEKMSSPTNQAAWLQKAGAPLEVGDAPLPKAAKGEIVVKNAAVAMNALDNHMQDKGVFVKEWPTVFGCDVAGEVYEVGVGVDRFKKGDRVIGHSINLVTGRPSDGGNALYTAVPAKKASILPASISFTDGVVVPFMVEAAACALSVKEPGPCMPGVLTPALGLPYPTLQTPAPSTGKTIIVYGASSGVGSMTTQLATAAGINVIAIAGAHNHDLVKQCGASQVFDHKDPAFLEKVTDAVLTSKSEFVGIFDAISTPATYPNDLVILQKLGGGHLACSHPPPADAPENVKSGMIFAVNDVATPLYQDYVTPALESGKLKCLPPPTIVGKGLGSIDEALKRCKAGVSGTKLVVEL
ncbi:putative secondary metabolism biosynthetic enzyme [Bacidia gigantensis]|uniref:putative secondary metabolism biosynthetic enzyme n=1 Tax=Bacidia gigantensis TaxID=2732470 RepID=UPI001D05140A|nr:putative secondary metabolism biosynthetic enzyme [Bacidia gigantensis]KAG8528342.1 putative secondary metabolism biosynthetic enzyme [Bacidia gigantensis]